MYLSKLILDIYDKSVQQALKDCTDMHRNIQKIFDSSRVESGVLYRVVTDKESVSMYVLADKEIKDEMLNNSPGLKLVGSKNLTDFEKNLQNGMILRFDIVAFPSKKIDFPDNKNSRRIFLGTRDEQQQWFLKKAEKGGFEVITMTINPAGTTHSVKKQGKMTFKRVRFSGLLKITECNEFINTWKRGIGAEKSYGMGMLMIR